MIIKMIFLLSENHIKMPHKLESSFISYSLCENDEESIKLAEEIKNYLEIDSDNPFHRIELWKNIDKNLLAEFKEKLRVEDKIIKPAIYGWDENFMVFLVRSKYEQEGPFAICNILVSEGIFYFDEQDKLNSDEGCIYCGEYIPKKYMHLIKNKSIIAQMS